MFPAINDVDRSQQFGLNGKVIGLDSTIKYIGNGIYESDGTITSGVSDFPKGGMIYEFYGDNLKETFNNSTAMGNRSSWPKAAMFGMYGSIQRGEIEKATKKTISRNIEYLFGTDTIKSPINQSVQFEGTEIFKLKPNAIDKISNLIAVGKDSYDEVKVNTINNYIADKVLIPPKKVKANDEDQKVIINYYPKVSLNVSDSNEKNKEKNSLKKPIEGFTYNLNQQIPPLSSKSNYLTKYEIVLPIDNRIKYKKTIINDKNNKVVSELFKIVIKNDKLIITPKDLKINSFYKNNYNIRVEVMPKKILRKSYNIKAQASVNLNHNSYKTNVVATTIPNKVINKKSANKVTKKSNKKKIVKRYNSYKQKQNKSKRHNTTSKQKKVKNKITKKSKKKGTTDYFYLNTGINKKNRDELFYAFKKINQSKYSKKEKEILKLHLLSPSYERDPLVSRYVNWDKKNIKKLKKILGNTKYKNIVDILKKQSKYVNNKKIKPKSKQDKIVDIQHFAVMLLSKRRNTTYQKMMNLLSGKQRKEIRAEIENYYGKGSLGSDKITNSDLLFSIVGDKIQVIGNGDYASDIDFLEAIALGKDKNAIEKILLDFYSKKERTIKDREKIENKYIPTIKQNEAFSSLGALGLAFGVLVLLPTRRRWNKFKEDFDKNPNQAFTNLAAEIAVTVVINTNKVYKKAKKVAKKVCGTVKKVVKKGYSKAKKVAKKVYRTVKKAAKKVYRTVKKAAKKVYRTVKKVAKKVYRTVKKVAKKVYRTVKKVTKKAINTVKRGFNKAKRIFRGWF